MSNLSAQGAATLLPDTWTVEVGEEKYTIRTFSLAKTIKTFSLLGELLEAADVQGVVSAAADSATAGEFSQVVAPGFVSRALLAVPKALRDGSPAVYRLLGLIVTPSSVLYRMEQEEEDIDSYLFIKGRELAHLGTNKQHMALLGAAVQAIGVETIMEQLPNLMRVFAAM